MGGVVLQTVMVERAEIHSRYLNRVVLVDFYVPPSDALSSPLRLLLLNDGQDLPTIAFDALLSHLLQEDRIQPLLCVGIHAGPERKMEYGTAHTPDYAGRGAKTKAYQDFLLLELLPHIQTAYPNTLLQQLAFGGFSLGGLMALDTVWQHPQLFSLAAVFSGSLWWRSKDLNNGYNEATDRIMHKQIRDGNYQAGLRFYFMTGSLDETSDRNNNGIIDSIDDTLDLIAELKALGYTDDAVAYINYEDGTHDVPTWGRALPHFLTWAFEKV